MLARRVKLKAAAPLRECSAVQRTSSFDITLAYNGGRSDLHFSGVHRYLNSRYDSATVRRPAGPDGAICRAWVLAISIC